MKKKKRKTRKKRKKRIKLVSGEHRGERRKKNVVGSGKIKKEKDRSNSTKKK